MLQKRRNIGQLSAVLVRISDCWGAPDDNCFTLSRSVEAGVHWVPCLEGKKEIPAYLPEAEAATEDAADYLFRIPCI